VKISHLRKILKAYSRLRKNNAKTLKLNGDDLTDFTDLKEAEKSSIQTAQTVLAIVVIKKIQKFLLKRKSIPVGLVKGIKQSDLLLKDKTKAKERYVHLRKLLRRFLKSLFGCQQKKSKKSDKKHKKGSKKSKDKSDNAKKSDDKTDKKEEKSSKKTTEKHSTTFAKGDVKEKDNKSYQPSKVPLFLEKRRNFLTSDDEKHGGKKDSDNTKNKNKNSKNIEDKKDDKQSSKNHDKKKGNKSDKNKNKKKNRNCKCGHLNKLVKSIIETYGTKDQIAYLDSKNGAGKKEADKTVSESKQIVKNIVGGKDDKTDASKKAKSDKKKSK